MDMARKMNHIVTLDHAVFHDFRNAGYGCERRLELVGYVGGKFPAKLFPFHLACHIHGQDHQPVKHTAFQHRIDYDTDVAASRVDHFRAACAPDGQIHRFAEAFAPVQGKQGTILSQMIHIQQFQNTLVVGQDFSIGIRHQETFAHMAGDHLEFPLLLLQLVHLRSDGLVLISQFFQKRRKLRIDFSLFRMLRIDTVDRLHDPFRKLQSQNGAQSQSYGRDQDHRPDHPLDQRAYGLLRSGKTQDRSVAQQLGIIQGLLLQRGRFSRTPTLSLRPGEDDLLPVRMVLHGGRIGIVVIQNGSCGTDQRYPITSRRKRLQI